MRRASGTGGRLSAAGTRPEAGAQGTRTLRALLGQLGEAKQRLQAETEVLRNVEGRVRGWDLAEAFQARRGHALRVEATVRFSGALDDLHGLLARLSDARLSSTLMSRPVSSGKRRLLAEIRSELRYLQRAFDGGNLLLASTLESFTS